MRFIARVETGKMPALRRRKRKALIKKHPVADAFWQGIGMDSGQTVFAAEAIHPASGIHDLLLARVKRV
mgnify:CR=1 FL=1|jgi:hypothetical protein